MRSEPQTEAFYADLKNLMGVHFSKPADDRPSVSGMVTALAHVQWELHRALYEAQVEAHENKLDVEDDATADEGHP